MAARSSTTRTARQLDRSSRRLARTSRQLDLAVQAVERAELDAALSAWDAVYPAVKR